MFGLNIAGTMVKITLTNVGLPNISTESGEKICSRIVGEVIRRSHDGEVYLAKYQILAHSGINTRSETRFEMSTFSPTVDKISSISSTRLQA